MYGGDTLDKGVTHVPGGTASGGGKFHHAAQNGVQFQTYGTSAAQMCFRPPVSAHVCPPAPLNNPDSSVNPGSLLWEASPSESITLSLSSQLLAAPSSGKGGEGPGTHSQVPNCILQFLLVTP